jgi:hypothetical protein
MVRFNRRRIRTRRFVRPAKPQAPLPPLEIDSLSDPSPEYAVEAVQAQSAPRSGQQDSTVELKAIPSKADPNEETQEAFPTDGRPVPPKRMQFTCPCGASLIATSEIYDKQTRCAMCQTVMLVNLVYDAETRAHEIVAFRINSESGP